MNAATNTGSCFPIVSPKGVPNNRVGLPFNSGAQFHRTIMFVMTPALDLGRLLVIQKRLQFLIKSSEYISFRQPLLEQAGTLIPFKR